jgi:hypothetical protein
LVIVEEVTVTEDPPAIAPPQIAEHPEKLEDVTVTEPLLEQMAPP